MSQPDEVTRFHKQILDLMPFFGVLLSIFAIASLFFDADRLGFCLAVSGAVLLIMRVWVGDDY